MAKSSKAGFKDTVAEYARLRKDVQERRFAPFYLLMGDEGYFIDQLGDLLAETILKPEERDFGQAVIYGKDSDSGMIVNLCRQMPIRLSFQTERSFSKATQIVPLKSFF